MAFGHAERIKMSGKNWAIVYGSTTDYIPGSDADDAKQAERIWREYRGLWFMEVTARPTTSAEDKALSKGAKNPQKEDHIKPEHRGIFRRLGKDQYAAAVQKVRGSK